MEGLPPCHQATLPPRDRLPGELEMEMEERRRIVGLLRSSLCFAAALGAVGCAGPERGRLGEMRGRTALIAEAEEARYPPPGGVEAGVTAFPLLFTERAPHGETVEVLWPVFEWAHGPRSSYLRVRPFF